MCYEDCLFLNGFCDFWVIIQSMIVFSDDKFFAKFGNILLCKFESLLELYEIDFHGELGIWF